MREDAVRIAENEDRFRKRNDLLRVGQARGDNLLLLCECGSADCTQTIHMTPEEYELLRSHPSHFAVVSGHEFPDVEAVVTRCGTYDVVEKLPGPGRDIVERDPR